MYSVLLNSTSELGSTFTTVVSMSFFSHTCWCNWVQSAVRFLLISAGVAMICQDIFLGILCDAEIWLLNRCRILSSVTFVCYSHTMTMASVFHALSCCAQKYTSLLGQSLVVGLLGNWFEKKNPHLKANENCSHFGRSPTYCPTHLRWLGIYLHLQSDHFFQWLGAEILLPRFYVTHLWSQKKSWKKWYGIRVFCFLDRKQCNTKEERPMAASHVENSYWFGCTGTENRKWAAVVDAWCDSCLACGILLKIFRTLVAPNLWMVVFWYKQLHNGKVQYFWMQAQKMLVTPLN